MIHVQNSWLPLSIKQLQNIFTHLLTFVLNINYHFETKLNDPKSMLSTIGCFAQIWFVKTRVRVRIQMQGWKNDPIGSNASWSWCPLMVIHNRSFVIMVIPFDEDVWWWRESLSEANTSAVMKIQMKIWTFLSDEYASNGEDVLKTEVLYRCDAPEYEQRSSQGNFWINMWCSYGSLEAPWILEQRSRD